MTEFLDDEHFQHLFPENFGGQNVEGHMTIELFTSLMKQFYKKNWMVGSGGAMGAIAGQRLFISPSALQKERLRSSDVFIYNMQEKSLEQRPTNPKITVSSCCFIFSLVMRQTGSECVIHTHSKAANLLSQLVSEDVFEISHQEYIKGIYNPFSGKNLKYDDTLSIPIIDNKPSESLLTNPIGETLTQYPQAVAVLVRNHGLFVWGPNWETTKIMTECIDYLLDLALDMLKHKIPLVKTAVIDKSENTDILQTVFDS